MICVLNMTQWFMLLGTLIGLYNDQKKFNIIIIIIILLLNNQISENILLPKHTY